MSDRVTIKLLSKERARMKKTPLLNRNGLILATMMILAAQAQASTVEKVAAAQNGQPERVQIVLDQSVQVGDKLYLVGADQKKVAIIQIQKVSSDQKKALAQVLKGKAAVGLMLLSPSGASVVPKTTATAAKNTDSSHKSTADLSSDLKTVSRSGGKISYGGLVGISMNTLKTKVAQYSNSVPESASLSGMGFNLKGIVDYKLMPDWTVTAISGIDQFTTKGNITNFYCDNGASQSCKVDIMYLSAEAYVKYNYLADKAWVGLGYGLFLPLSYSMNIPSLSKPGLQNTVFISTGYNLRVSPKMTIPFNFHYGLDLVDPSVETSSILLQTGVVFPY